MSKKKKVRYRKPRVYIPPYNYCDRVCARCRIDKTRCLLYQTEMDEQLHREIDGKGEPTFEETVERMKEDARLAIRLIEEQAQEMGVDLGPAVREAPSRPERSPDRDPLSEEAVLLARATSSFLRSHGRRFEEEAAVLRRAFVLPGPKIGRAALPAADELEAADRILQAQTAHRAMGEMAGALESIRKRDSALGDEMIEILALIGALRREVEARWLSRANDFLVPVTDEAWWGPLRDITPTLRHFRR